MIELKPLMAEALRLTKSGDLGQATRLIQSSLARRVGKPFENGGTGGPPTDLKPSQRMRALPRPEAENHPQAKSRPDRTDFSADAGRFEERRYVGPEGKMSYMLYLPAGIEAGAPLVIMLHGCTQTPENFAMGTGMNGLADEMGFIVAYPRQTSAANLQRCWNWFRLGDQQRDKGEPALITAIVRQIVSDHGADQQRIYAAGLSAGGAAAAILGETYPDIFAAIGIHSGLDCGAARDMPSAFAAMRNGPDKSHGGTKSVPFVPVITFHGDRDATVDPVNSARIIANAAQASPVALTTHKQTSRSTDAHAYTREVNHGPDGAILIESWTVHGAGHAWSGGHAPGTYIDKKGPDASRAMATFFLRHSLV